MFYYERKLKEKGFRVIIGIDEAGRGPLAGPVVAAAVTLKAVRFKNRIDDSKKLNYLSREKAFREIIDKSLFGIGIIDEKVIDRVNILVATQMAMEQAVASLRKKIRNTPDKRMHIIVDGNMPISTGIACTAIIKGDAKSKSIASASIIAKVTRDRIMDFYDRMYPHYGFAKHKGYGTREHLAQLKKFGLCLIHRKTFCRAFA